MILILNDVRDLILELADVEEIKKIIDGKLKSGVDPAAILDTLSQALKDIGEKYEKREFFLSELMMAGYIAHEISNSLKPYLYKNERKTFGKVVIGTVKGDLHDIGKNIVIMMLNTAGFEIIDLGIDVPDERFVQAVRDEKPDILALSALLTSTMNEMKIVIGSLKKNGLRNKVKVIVGGRSITSRFADVIGADGYAEDAVKAIQVATELLGKRSDG